jgi:isoleucyl-tRNA synthetase
VQLSSVYGNAMKDRLYCDEPNSPARRRAQTVMHRLAIALTKLLAPMVVFTADEAWDHIPHKSADEANLASVHLALLPQTSHTQPSPADQSAWNLLMKLRESALAQLDVLKKSVELNKALEAEVIFHVDEPTRQTLESFGIDLEDMAGVGHHSFEVLKPSEAASVEVVDRRQTYGACARCWKRRPDVGSDAEYPDLCARDAAAVRAGG